MREMLSWTRVLLLFCRMVLDRVILMIFVLLVVCHGLDSCRAFSSYGKAMISTFQELLSAINKEYCGSRLSACSNECTGVWLQSDRVMGCGGVSIPV